MSDPEYKVASRVLSVYCHFIQLSLFECACCEIALPVLLKVIVTVMISSSMKRVPNNEWLL